MKNKKYKLVEYNGFYYIRNEDSVHPFVTILYNSENEAALSDNLKMVLRQLLSYNIEYSEFTNYIDSHIDMLEQRKTMFKENKLFLNISPDEPAIYLIFKNDEVWEITADDIANIDIL